MARTTSIRAKLIAIVMATTCASLVLAGVALAVFELMSGRDTLVEETATVASIIGANCTAALTFEDAGNAREILGSLAPQETVLAACLYDAGGRLFASYEREGALAPCPSMPPGDGVEIGAGVLVRADAVVLQGTRIGTLRLAATLGTLFERLRLFGWGLLGIITLSALAGLLLSSRLEGLVSRPILELARTARRISEQEDYALRAPKWTDDETGVAVAAFNQMLDRIEDADRALRQAGEQSLEQARFLESILDSMGEGMVVCDLAGTVVLWNAAAVRLLGPSGVGRGLDEVVSGLHVFSDEGRTRLEARDLPLARALATAAAADREIFVGGRWLGATARPLYDERGGLRGAIGVFRDLTERKRAEAELAKSELQLRQAQKMEAVGRLAGGVAHDFNNLLTAIRGYSELALDSIGSDHPARADIEEVEKAGERAAGLTRQLLAFSRKQVLAPELLDLNTIVQSQEKMLRRLIGEDIELVSVCAPKLGVVKADPSQIEQVILNLAVNARDAMPEGGRLTITTADVELDEVGARDRGLPHAGRWVRLSVIDTGVGMAPETQAHIFEPFFTTKEKGKGTGLGLSTVYGIVEQSGGRIAVTSALGRGATFDIFLPRAAEPAEAVQRPAVSAPLPRGTETILLVEDEEQVRVLAHRVLTGLGYRVLVAVDGVDALRVQGGYAGRIHLLVTDVVMPRMSGRELARQIIERAPGIGVLFVSGYTDDTIMQQGVLGGDLAFLHKPFTAETLAERVREVLARCTAATPT